MYLRIPLLISLCLGSAVTKADEQNNVEHVRIPAFTAYLDPDAGGARIRSEGGVTNWKDRNTKIIWYGQLQQSGPLKARLQLKLPDTQKTALTLSVAGQNETLQIAGAGNTVVSTEWSTFQIPKNGYYTLTLQRAGEATAPACDVIAIELAGEAAKNAHFNLKPRRNAASVHLAYPVEREKQVSAFYCEMTGIEDPVWTYYMACGWHRGYFGMQVNSPTERRIIFSVWDSGNEAVDRKKVEAANRVTLVDKGEDVYTGSFGNEGTGGHSHLKFQWKTGERQRFLVTAEPVDETHTIYSGYYFRPDQKKWMLISSWNAPKEGGYMRGLYSFSENFVGRNGNVLRKALFGNQWIRTSDGTWHELTTAKFSHDATGRADRKDRFMGLEDGQFFLSHGGFVDGFTKFGTPFERPVANRPPQQGALPPLPNKRPE